VPVVAGTYPGARPGRIGGGAVAQAAAAAAGLGPPRTRILAFQVSCNASVRTTVSSARILGPAILQHLNVLTSVISTDNYSLEVGIAAGPVTEQDVATTVPKGWTPITERLSQNAAAEAAKRVGFGSPSWSVAGVIHPLGVLNYVVALPEFYVTISVVSNATAGSKLTGHLVVLEGVNPAALANFL